MLITIILFYLSGILSIHVRVMPEFTWGAHFGGNFTAECSIPCIWDDNGNDIDAKFNIVMNNPQIRRAKAHSQLYPINIIGCMEGQHYYSLVNREYFRAQHQVSALIDRKSDIPWMYTGNFVETQKIPQSPNTASKAFIATRNCFPKNERNELVQSIMKHIPVDSLSICMNNGKWPKCGEVSCSKIEVAARYKLLLAFENGDSPGYITEKIYDGYIAGVLPVYYGTSEISNVVPRGSYIDVSDFDSFDEVGLYLKQVLENETLYNSYFYWKKQLLDPDFLSYMEPIWNTSVQCRVCKFVDAMKRGLEWNQYLQESTPISMHPHNYSIDMFNRVTNRIILPKFVVFLYVMIFAMCFCMPKIIYKKLNRFLFSKRIYVK